MNNHLSKWEETLFERYFILFYTRQVLQSDLNSVQKSLFKLKEPYTQLIHTSIGLISKELFEVKSQLHKRNIQIEFGTNDGTFTEFHCYFRGYERTSRYLNVHLKNKVQAKLCSFFVDDHPRS